MPLVFAFVALTLVIIGRPQKRKFRGPWYSQRPAESSGVEESGKNKKSRTFTRNFDSAVFMGSDGTNEDDDTDSDLSSSVQVPGFASGSQQSFASRPSIPLRPARLSDLHSPEELANKHIQSCIEDARENIDLTDRGLDILPSHILKQLQYFVSATSAHTPNNYKALDPKLKLFLSSNSFTRVPGEICNLVHLTVVSLRNNKLVELPSRIAMLQSLVELNVANNNLSYLPYELLVYISCATGPLQTLQIHPNPFYEPSNISVSSDDEVVEKLEVEGDTQTVSTCWHVNYKYRSFVRFLASDGRLLKGPNLPRDQSLFTSNSGTIKMASNNADCNSIPVAPLNDIPAAPGSTSPSKAFSLHELAVRAWSVTPHMPDLSTYLGEEAPAQLSRLLEDASTLREQEGGDRHCTICHRAFVIPRTEWIEWWEISKERNDPSRVTSAASPLRQMDNGRDQVERKVPFMRRGCSWKCLPTGDTEMELRKTMDHLLNDNPIRSMFITKSSEESVGL